MTTDIISEYPDYSIYFNGAGTQDTFVLAMHALAKACIQDKLYTADTIQTYLITGMADKLELTKAALAVRYDITIRDGAEGDLALAIAQLFAQDEMLGLLQRSQMQESDERSEYNDSALQSAKNLITRLESEGSITCEFPGLADEYKNGATSAIMQAIRWLVFDSEEGYYASNSPEPISFDAFTHEDITGITATLTKQIPVVDEEFSPMPLDTHIEITMEMKVSLRDGSVITINDDLLISKNSQPFSVDRLM